MFKKIFSFFIIIIILLLFSFTVSCKMVSISPGKTEEAVTPGEDIDETPLEEVPIETEEELKEEPGEEITQETIEPVEEPDVEIPEDQKDEITDEDFLNILNSFLEAVKTDSEYIYFSSATAAIVGTEEEYKNGTKSDFYFIIKESHSAWENIKIDNVTINGDVALIEITGDRTAEGTLYEDENITFRFINENGNWKIDFG